MDKELETVRQMKREVGHIRALAVASVKDSRTALRLARALVLLHEAECILKAEAKKLADGTCRRSELARAAVGWNLNSAHGRMVLAREIVQGLWDNGGPVQVKKR